MNCRSRSTRATLLAIVLIAFAATANPARGQQSSISTFDAADFRIWGYIPYWATNTQINNFATNGMYGHVSDVLYFGAVRPDASGNLTYGSSAYQATLNTLRSQSASSGFNLHLSMMAVSGGSVDSVWTSIVNSATNRANFVTQLKTLMLGGAGAADDIRGMNFDWERPSTATLWGNYTQLAREVRAAFKDPSTPSTNNWETSVCDYGSTDFNWDNTSLFDAKVFDQLFVMSYHLSAASTGTYTDQKLTLTGQGAAKAFSNDQIGVGFGTWGTGGPATVDLETFAQGNPNLPYDQLSITGTYNDINGVSRTGTWTIESRKQVREKTQLALDRGMPGMFSWTLHYDALNNLGLHRVIHHYMAFQRNAPDLNLDGHIDAADATALANNMGMLLTNTGTVTVAQFDAFYLNGNWEKGDHDGNGLVNQTDADWLAARYTALGVNLPDRLPFSGTFESFSNARGLTGRWRAGRNASNQLNETSNFKHEPPNLLSFTASGAGGGVRSNNFVTMRNQNATEAASALNNLPRIMTSTLATPIDLAQSSDAYFTCLVRENGSALSASQLASNNRTLSLQFLDSAGADQFDVVLRGLQGDFSILSQADMLGQDAGSGGFFTNTTYLIVGKLTGNGSGANTMQMSWFQNGQSVGDFTSPAFAWKLTAHGSGGYDPTITDVRFMSLFETSYTVSNLWVGGASLVPEPAGAALVLTMLLPALVRRRRSRG